jgi:hypothetical protein
MIFGKKNKNGKGYIVTAERSGKFVAHVRVDPMFGSSYYSGLEEFDTLKEAWDAINDYDCDY